MDAGNVRTAGLVSATGNITGGNLIISGNLVDTGDLVITSSAANANVIITPTGTGAIRIDKDLLNGQANGVGNIGNSTGYFNTVFAKATSAQYADLAELYAADTWYDKGTVLSFGGEHEVTITMQDSDSRVAGVVSSNPSYVMNAGLTADRPVQVALIGRVPVSVVGAVSKGDLMVSAGNGCARADNSAKAGTILGKALENHPGPSGMIEIVVGRV